MSPAPRKIAKDRTAKPARDKDGRFAATLSTDPGPLDLLTDEEVLAEHVASCARDPLRFVETVFPWGSGALADEAGPDAWQRDLLADLRDRLSADPAAPVRMAVASGHGVGKTALSAWLILWFMSTREHPQLVVTANTAAQLRNKTWRELAKWHRLAAHAHWFDWTAARFTFRAHPETWFAAAVPWSRERPESFAGTHERHVCVIFDEASSIAEPIWDVTEGAMVTPGALWFAFGNPTRNTGRFRECFRRFRHRWATRAVDSRTARKANRGQLDAWVADYGEDSDFVRVRVRGVFPRAGFAQFVPEAVVEAALGRDPEVVDGQPLILGVDVARFGDDASVILARQGQEIAHLAHYRGVDTMRLAALVAEAANRFRPAALMVDGAGVGAGVVDRLRALGHRVVDVNAGARALDPLRFANLRAEMWSKARDWLKAGGGLPADARALADDLAAPEYGFDDKGRLKLESKDDMKARGIASPDFGDALAMTFAEPVSLAAFESLHRPRMAESDYDPLAPASPPPFGAR